MNVDNKETFSKVEQFVNKKLAELERHIKESKSFLSTYKHNHRGENVNPTAATQEEYDFLMKCKAQKGEFSNVLKKLNSIASKELSKDDLLKLKEKYNTFGKQFDAELNKKASKKSR